MDIFGRIRRNQPDYSSIKEKCIMRIHDHEKMDVSVIIPVHGRIHYNNTVTRHFKQAIAAYGRKISVTVVEHAREPEHISVCESWVNYIFIPMEDGIFNKSLAHNIAALYGPDSEYLHFHDVDIIVPPDYYYKIFENLRGKDALQAFSKRRLFQADEYITGKIMNARDTFYGVVPWSSRHVKENEAGASGGSIFVKRSMFIKVGGFDPELYSQYSIEDQQFFDKLNYCGVFGFCDDPPIDLLHLWHPVSFDRTTKQSDWDAYAAYKDLDDGEKRRMFEMKSDHLKKHISGLYSKFKILVDRMKSDTPESKLYQDEDCLVHLGEEILEWVIEDFSNTHWMGWPHILKRITNCDISPADRAGWHGEMAKDWKIWYEQIYMRRKR